MNLKKGDNVKILTGKDRGKSGKILRVLKDEKVLVEGINLSKKHARPKKRGEKGQTVTVPRAVHVSNTMIICGNCKKPTRIGFRIDGGSKSRICRKCEALL